MNNFLKRPQSVISDEEFALVWVGLFGHDAVGLADSFQVKAIVCSDYGSDLVKQEENFQIYSIEKSKEWRPADWGTPITGQLLGNKKIKAKLRSLGKNIAILPFFNFEVLEKVCREEGWRLLSTPVKIREEFRLKTNLRRILKKLKIKQLPGEVLNFGRSEYLQLKGKYGLPFVIQFDEGGGGSGVFIIRNEKQFDSIKKRNPDKKAHVVKYVKGPSLSISACVTEKGVLTTAPRYMVIGVRELTSNPTAYCGNDFIKKIPPKICNQAINIAIEIGKYMGKKGYRGNFGVDYITDFQTEECYLTEINPRFGAAVGIETSLSVEQGVVPIVGFHINAFLDNLDFDFRVAKERLAGRLKGSQLLVHSRENGACRIKGDVLPGVYRVMNGKIKYLRWGENIKDVKHRDEVVVCSGVVRQNQFVESEATLLRIMTHKSVLAEDGCRLNKWGKMISGQFYSMLFK